MFDIRFRSTSHKRPPKIIIFGPVGCGRTTQATLMSKNYGIVLICVKNLLKQEIKNTPEVGEIIQRCFDNGDSVPDDILIPIVEDRIQKSDCRLYGWILDGFGYTRPQLESLKKVRAKPTQVFVLE